MTLAEGIGDRALIGRIHWGRGGVHYLTEVPEIENPEAALAEYRLAAEYLAGTDEIFDIGWTETNAGERAAGPRPSRTRPRSTSDKV